MTQKHVRWIVVLVSCVGLLSACASGAQGSESILAYGFLEAQDTRILTLQGGAVAQVNVVQGDQVHVDEALIVLDSPDLFSVQEQTRAGFQAARAQLALVQLQIDHLTLRASIDTVGDQLYVKAGENDSA